MRWFVALSLVVGVTGCRQLFGIDDTAVATAADATALPDAVAVSMDAAPDGPDAGIATCGASYAPLPGGFPPGASYRGVNNRTTWPLARTSCTNDGGDLVVVDDATEADAVAMLVQDTASSYLWIGVYDPAGGVEGDWTTVQGTPATYLPWASGEPSGGNTDCVLLADNGSPHQLYDFMCGGPQVYVCECLPP